MKKIIMTAIISAFMSSAAFAADATTQPAAPAKTEAAAPAHKAKKHHEVKCHVTKDGKKETTLVASVADCHKAGGKVDEHHKKPAAAPAAH